ncbi:MAG TPA: hypothetical protein VKA09_10285 [Nitrososphaeraceae archaeon]|nr:hypothetical protein [Nitrososphaeraceae archaeon]
MVREVQSLFIITPSFVLTLTWEICVGGFLERKREESWNGFVGLIKNRNRVLIIRTVHLQNKDHLSFVKYIS